MANAINSRIFTTDGKSNSSSSAKTFGLTVKDRYTTGGVPANMTQLTMVPVSTTETLQNHRFILAARDSDGMATTNTLTITPDLTLDHLRFYQFQAYLTIIVQDADGIFFSGHYTMTSAAKGDGASTVALIGGGYGYRLDTICSDSGMDERFDETAITMTVNGSNKFVITITAASAITTSVDLIADISINSAVFTP